MVYSAYCENYYLRSVYSLPTESKIVNTKEPIERHSVQRWMGTLGQLKSFSNNPGNFERLYDERRFRRHCWKVTQRMTSLIGFSEKEQVISGWSALEIFKLRFEAPLYLPVLANFLSKDELLRIFIMLAEQRPTKYPLLLKCFEGFS